MGKKSNVKSDASHIIRYINIRGASKDVCVFGAFWHYYVARVVMFAYYYSARSTLVFIQMRAPGDSERVSYIVYSTCVHTLLGTRDLAWFIAHEDGIYNRPKYMRIAVAGFRVYYWFCKTTFGF